MTSGEGIGALVSREEFVGDVGRAIARGDGYAAGKLGNSEIALLYAPIFLQRTLDPIKRRAFQTSLAYQSSKFAGLFPPTDEFLSRYVAFDIAHTRNLDCIGLFQERPAMEAEVIREHGLRAKLIPYRDQEPDRSVPDAPGRCYLPFLRGRRLLLVSSHARFLRDRANQETFESVWAKTGKKWFHPSHVEAVEFPYGFSRATHDRYPDSLALFSEIAAEIARREFDVALIAAGGLGIPVASFIKSLGKVALSLGGHLQALFGVQGERWRSQPGWQERYVTPAWTDLPPAYRLSPGESYENYW